MTSSIVMPGALRSFDMAALEASLPHLSVSKPAEYETALQKIHDGKDVTDYVDSLAMVLFGEEEVKFSDFTLREKQACILLLLACWQKTDERGEDKHKYLDLLLYIVPYCLDYLDTICTPELTKSRLNSEQAFAHSLDVAIRDFLENKDGELLPSDTRYKNCVEFLRCTPADNDSRFLSEALIQWYKTVCPEPFLVADAVHCYATFGCKMKRTEDNVQNEACVLLTKLFLNTGDAGDILQAFFIRSNRVSTILAWSETLQSGPNRDLFLDLVNAPTFPSNARKAFVQQYLRDDAPDKSFELALRLVPSLEYEQIEHILIRIVKRNNEEEVESAHLNLVIKGITAPGFPAHTRNKVIECFLKMPALVFHLENLVYEKSLCPSADFFVEMVTYKSFPEKAREAIIRNYTSSSQSPHPHALLVAARLLMPRDVELISLVADKLVERMIEKPICRFLNQFFNLPSEKTANPEIKDKMASYLLSKQNPGTTSFIKKMAKQMQTEKANNNRNYSLRESLLKSEVEEQKNIGPGSPEPLHNE